MAAIPSASWPSSPDQHRRAGDGRPGRRRAGRLDRRARRAAPAGGRRSTSVPGVAQRTGATIYYIEMVAPEPEARRAVTPVLSLMPAPGEVDIVVGAELMEAGRAILRGLVCAGPDAPDRLLAPLARREREGRARRRHRRRVRRSMTQPMSQPIASSHSTWPRLPMPPAARCPRCCSVRWRAPAALPFARRISRQPSAPRASASMAACAPSRPAASALSPSSKQESKNQACGPSRRSRKLYPRLEPIGDAGYDALVACALHLPAELHGIVAAGLQQRWSTSRTLPMARTISIDWRPCRVTRSA